MTRNGYAKERKQGAVPDRGWLVAAGTIVRRAPACNCNLHTRAYSVLVKRPSMHMVHHEHCHACSGSLEVWFCKRSGWRTRLKVPQEAGKLAILLFLLCLDLSCALLVGRNTSRVWTTAGDCVRNFKPSYAHRTCGLLAHLHTDTAGFHTEAYNYRAHTHSCAHANAPGHRA